MLAGVTARTRQFSLVTNCSSMSRIWNSMSAGWSPTGTLVRPGRSTTVRFSTGERGREREGGRWTGRGRERGREGGGGRKHNTHHEQGFQLYMVMYIITTSHTHTLILFTRSPCGENILRLMGTLEMPLFFPVSRSVSPSISFRTSLKSVNFFPFAWRNSAHSTNINIRR